MTFSRSNLDRRQCIPALRIEPPKSIGQQSVEGSAYATFDGDDAGVLVEESFSVATGGALLVSVVEPDGASAALGFEPLPLP